ncbi:hypothetical protein J1N35_015050 [Gossypium stocksii]|uniref:Uncharacterized protein n=1 Tax=Gossypium stocksii TaxID=47602 RepID=A0A9D3VY35_9ROSI|nr:hypothetical protein J1N35_015050 [Gossypium stocksii]
MTLRYQRPDEGLRTLTSVPVRMAKMVENADSPTTQLCGGFTTLLESSHYDIPESPMGRHSSVSTLDFNCKRQNTEQLGFCGRTECMTLTWHSVNGLDMNFDQSMFIAGNTY